MPGPDPTCTVNGVFPPIDVAASSSITIGLASPAGVRYWSIQCTSTDELDTPAAVNATLVVNQTNKTATCSVSSVLGAAYIFTSTVGINGLGLDANSTRQKSFTTTFKVNVKATNAARVLAEDETFEQSAAAGWCAVVNPALRAGVSVPISISGTGLLHATGSNIDPTTFNGAANQFLVENAAGTDQTFVTIGTVLRGHINVTHSSPGTLDATHQIAYCDSATGTCSVTFPNAASFGGTIPDDWQILVVDTGGAAATSNISALPNGSNAWDPTAQAFGTSTIVGTINGFAGLWQWDSNKSHWVLVNAGGGGSGAGPIPAPGTTLTANTTIGPTDIYKLFAAGTYTITWGAILAGVIYRLQHDAQADLASSGVVMSRGSNTFTMEDPQNRSAAHATGTVPLVVANSTYEFMLDSTNNILRCLRQVQ